MGKDREGDLWDDSALISAFDDAMSKYKKMHGMKNNGSPSEVGGAVSGVEKSSSGAVEGNPVEESVVESDAVAEAGEASNLLSANEDTSAATAADEPHPVSSGFMPTNDAVNAYSYSQGLEEYNQLLTEYYELEEKREKILQKLHQYGNWNYQTEPSGSDPGLQQSSGAHPSQEQPVPADQISHSIDSCACCPYFSQSFVAPCPTFVCSYGGTYTSQDVHSAASLVPRDSLPLKDCDITRTGIEAAEKAISSLKIECSSISEGKVKNEEGAMVGITSAETNLADVLNAWYSAGFCTGKYLSEKSIREKRKAKQTFCDDPQI